MWMQTQLGIWNVDGTPHASLAETPQAQMTRARWLKEVNKKEAGFTNKKKTKWKT